MPRMLISIDGVVIQEVHIVKQRTTLGRRHYNDVVIDNLAISGEHAALHMDLHSHVVEVEDLHSTNGITVNGRPVARKELKHGDVVELGRYKLRFYTEPVEAFAATMYYKPDSPPLPFAQPDAPHESAPVEPPAAHGQSAASAPSPFGGESSAAAAPEVLPPAVAAVAAAGLHVEPTRAAAPTPPSEARLPGSAGTSLIRILSGESAGREVLLNKVVTTFGKPGVAVASITHRRNAFVLSHIEGAHPPVLNGSSIGDTAVPLENGDTWVLAGTQMQFVTQEVPQRRWADKIV